MSLDEIRQMNEIEKMIDHAKKHYRGSFVQADADFWKKRIELLKGI